MPPPFYFKFTEEQIYGYYRDRAESTRLPLIVYSIPLAEMMSVDTIACLSKMKKAKGVRYTGTALDEVMQIRELCLWQLR